MEPIKVEVHNHGDGYRAIGTGLKLDSTLLLGSPVPYEETSDYKRTITIIKDSSYQIMPYTIIERPMKGYQALVLVPTPAFRFLDLPTEVRDIIYELVLADDTTELKLYKQKASSSGKVVGQGQYNAKLDKYIDKAKRTPLSLLEVNKQVYSEAFQVPYRSPVFKLDCGATPYRFLNLNQNCAEHLTHIIVTSVRLWNWELSKAISALARLRPNSLQTIEISCTEFRAHGASRGKTYVDTVRFSFKFFSEVLDAVHVARREKKVKVGVEHLVEFSYADCDNMGENMEC